MPARILMSLLWAFALIGATSVDASPVVYAVRPGQVMRLVDANGDGDYLEAGEVLVYADGLAGSPQGIAVRGAEVFVLHTTPSGVLVLRDLNSDGDALDSAEAAVFADLASLAPMPTLRGLAVQSDGGLLCGDLGSGLVYRLEDLTEDGDALDAGEVAVVADGLVDCRALAGRSDGRLLAAVSTTAVPVRILRDRNADGDCLDFAENISYAEDFAAGVGLAAVDAGLSFLLRSSDGRVLALRDLTGDDDALDAGEVVTWAEGISSPAAIATAEGDVFVSANDAAGTVHRFRDANGDGDALDFGEAQVVATGVTMPAGMATNALATACLAGDLDGDGLVSPADVPLFVAALLDVPPPAELCRADLNLDTLIDGRDIRPFTDLLVP